MLFSQLLNSNDNPCPICDNNGLVRVEVDGRWVTRTCECQSAKKLRILKEAAQIPKRNVNNSLKNFKVEPHSRGAHMLAAKFVDEFIPGNTTRGLLFTGSMGTGKTHLACGILNALMETKGVHCLVVDYRDILDRLRTSMDADARESKTEIMDPLFRAELVMIDELGSQQLTDWVLDRVEALIDDLYKRMVPLIVTTNYPIQSVAVEGRWAPTQSLKDRIGGRSVSRLCEMCTMTDIIGPDYRLKVKEVGR